MTGWKGGQTAVGQNLSHEAFNITLGYIPNFDNDVVINLLKNNGLDKNRFGKNNGLDNYILSYLLQ